MKETFTITGMTCNGCVASVTEKLAKVDGITSISIDLAAGQANIVMNKSIALKNLSNALPDKYTISKKVSSAIDISVDGILKQEKFQQLKPLFLIFVYLLGASFLRYFRDWNTTEFMLDFMGLFYIVFSFFKLLDLKGFSYSFRMYDPLAKVLPTYGWVYPFIELVLGVLFLMRIQIIFALIITIIILGITTLGVTKALLDKKSIQCACLGTALKLPMTEATFIENAIMLVMAITMLV